MPSSASNDTTKTTSPTGYSVSGKAAHGRIGRLFRDLLEEATTKDADADADAEGNDRRRRRRRHGGRRWIDRSPHAAPSTPTASSSSEAAAAAAPEEQQQQQQHQQRLAFLWENAPRAETKYERDAVKCYSHLPNGILLDDKWALARLLGRKNDGGDNDGGMPELAALESHCFRGADFGAFAGRLGLIDGDIDNNRNRRRRHDEKDDYNDEEEAEGCREKDAGKHRFEDLLPSTAPPPADDDADDDHDHDAVANADYLPPPPPPPNLWVLKDAMSNGAGGIWILDPSNAREFLPLNDDDDRGNNSSATNNKDDERATDRGQQAHQSSSSSNNSNNNHNNNKSVLHPQHRYIAQRYAWPPTLYSGRKCHVRAYALITADGRAHVHKKAFLHVANEQFREGGAAAGADGRFEGAVHITNCCANSHDEDKFAGEICADLELMGTTTTTTATTASEDDDNDGGAPKAVPLGEYRQSISASVAALAERFAPFAIKGGRANGGFEYLGLDFVLSSVEDPSSRAGGRRRPVAYLLEANAPPSQDTATGLERAEAVHDEVLSDLLRLWVLPKLGVARRKAGGWRCVYEPPGKEDGEEEEDDDDYDDEQQEDSCEEKKNLIVPSKASILNRIRWAMRERRALKEEALMMNSSNDVMEQSNLKLEISEASSEVHTGGSGTREDKDDHPDILSCESKKYDLADFDTDAFATHVRSQYPYFSDPEEQINITGSDSSSSSIHVERIFFESGGGAQVPKIVSNAMMASLSNRDRSMAGAKCQLEARAALTSLLIGEGSNDSSIDDHAVTIMGANATSLLDQLARKICESGLISKGDEIVIASENHLANVTPWLSVAKMVGAKIRWWTVTDDACRDGQQQQEQPESSCILSDLVNAKTKVVAISHVSNILGQTRDVESACNLVRRVTSHRGQVVVDGVTAAPHLLCTGLSSNGTAAGGGPDWYVVSLHKMFGPHLGCLVGKRSSAVDLYANRTTTSCCEGGEAALEPSLLSNEQLAKSWELGTMNYEACAGAVALENYFGSIATYAMENFGLKGYRESKKEDEGANSGAPANGNGMEVCYVQQQQTSNQITFESSNDHLGEDGVGMSPSQEGCHAIITSSSGNAPCHCSSHHLNIARMCIQRAEDGLLNHLLECVSKYAPLVQIIQDTGSMQVASHGAGIEEVSHQRRIPIVSFVHTSIPSCTIVQHCRNHGVICRACKFLSTKRLRDELCIEEEGVVRFSLAHYNTLDEINVAIRVLEMLNGWSFVV